MQQFAVQPYVDCDQHGAGALVSSLPLAEERGGFCRHTALDLQEWNSNLHHLHARNSRRSWIPSWELASERWHSFFSAGTVGRSVVALAIEPQ